MDINLLRGIATIVVMASFLSIFWWAYIYRSKESFNDAANLPFVDDTRMATNRPNQSNPIKRHGDQK